MDTKIYSNSTRNTVTVGTITKDPLGPNGVELEMRMRTFSLTNPNDRLELALLVNRITFALCGVPVESDIDHSYQLHARPECEPDACEDCGALEGEFHSVECNRRWLESVEQELL